MFVSVVLDPSNVENARAEAAVLTRFGFNYLKMICDFHKTEIIIVNREIDDKSVSEELAEDIISIIHSFSGKLYGIRKSVKENICKELNSDNDDSC